MDFFVSIIRCFFFLLIFSHISYAKIGLINLNSYLHQFPYLELLNSMTLTCIKFYRLILLLLEFIQLLKTTETFDPI